MNLTRIAVDRPVTTVMFFLILILISMVSLSRLPIDLMPDIVFPVVNVIVTYEGAAPEEIETLITRPLEEAMGSIDNVVEITSDSSEERGRVQLEFNWGTDIDVATNNIRERLDWIRDVLPEDADSPVLFKFDPNMFPILFLGISGSMDPVDLRYLAEHTIKYRLERVPGVASADVSGGLRREIQVNLIREKIDALRLSPRRVVQAIRMENLDLPAGQVDEGDIELLVRTKGQLTSLEELGRIVITTREGIPVYLRDIAEIVDGFEELREVERINGQPGISMYIQKQSGSNTVQVADATYRELEQLRQDLPHVQITALFDSARFIRQSINTVRTAALSGAVLAVIVLMFFLRNIRSTVIIATAIPISVMASFSLIYFGGFTLNLVSFGGLALGIGLLVDNSIVVLENVFRHREQGVRAREAALDGSSEVSSAIVASTMTTVVVFLPMIFLSGPASVMFGQLAYVVTFALICSLLIALTLIPMLCRTTLRYRPPEEEQGDGVLDRVFQASERGFNRADEVYTRMLHWALGHRRTMVLGSIGLLFIVVPMMSFVGFEFMPPTDEGEVRVYVEMAPGSRLEAMDVAFLEVEDRVHQVLGTYITNVQTSFGGGSWWRSSGYSGGSLRIKLVDLDQRDISSEQAAHMLRLNLSDIPGLIVRTRASGGLFLMKFQSQGESVGIDIRGFDRAESMRIAEQVQKKIEEHPGITDSRISRGRGRPEVTLEIDRHKAGELGLSVFEIAETVRTAFGGEVATRYRDAGDEYDVRVRFREGDRLDLEDLRSLWLVTPTGERVPASNFVTLVSRTGPMNIERVNQERSVTVAANLAPGAPLGNVVSDLRELLREITLPRGFSFVYGGEYEDQQESYQQLGLALILAVLLVYMVMASLFESLVHPLIIMFSIPFAVIGVILTLLLTGTTLNVQALMGVIMLAGIVVNNAIVLLDYVNMLRRTKGVSLREAVEEGGRRRLRPILMTTLTTCLALTPMGIGLGEGSELQAPMARVVIGGLLVSTMITLVLIPTIYTIIEERRQRAAALRGTKREAVGAQPSARPA
jgi:HAE1 family hydrophobic/amphiphilic exporter-1